MRHPVLPIIGGSGPLGSAALLYVVYRPFSIALEQFIRSGNAESLGLLRAPSMRSLPRLSASTDTTVCN
jgi:hypothetical protein